MSCWACCTMKPGNCWACYRWNLKNGCHRCITDVLNTRACFVKLKSWVLCIRPVLRIIGAPDVVLDGPAGAGGCSGIILLSVVDAPTLVCWCRWRSVRPSLTITGAGGPGGLGVIARRPSGYTGARRCSPPSVCRTCPVETRLEHRLWCLYDGR